MADSSAGAASLAAAGRATVVLTAATVVVQLIGFARQLFLAAEVGIDSTLDALLIALAAPQALVAVLSTGVATAIVPAYAHAKDASGAVAARRLVGTVLVWLGLAGLLLTILLWVFADGVVAITAPGLSDAGTADDAAGFLRLVAPLALIMTVSAVMHADCQAERLFGWMTVATVASPFLALAITVYYWDTLGLDGLAIGTLVGAMVALTTLVLATILRRVHPLPHLVSRGSGLRDLARHAAPLSLSSAVLQVSQVADRLVATLVLPGGVSALRYGNSIVRLPFGAIRPAYRTAIYPTLVETTRESSSAGLGATAGRVLGYGVVFFVPLAGLTIAVAPLAATILYDRGSFSQADLALTASVVAASAPLIVTWTIQPTLTSSLNALRKGSILLVTGLLTMGLRISLDVILGYSLGIVGIALATTLASVVTMLFMSRQLGRLEPDLPMADVWRTLAKATLAALPSVLVFGLPLWAGYIPGDVGAQVVLLVVAGLAGLTSYYYLARRLGLEEAGAIVAFGTGTVRRSGRRLAALFRRSP